MKKTLILCSLATFILAEPSAFMAGDLDSNNPYGLTKDEKYIWTNKENIKKLNKIIIQQKIKINNQSKQIQRLKLQILNINTNIDTLNQKLDGVQSLLSSVDNVNMKIASLKQNMQQELNQTNSVLFGLKDEVVNMQKNITTLQELVNRNKTINDSNTKIVIGLVENLAKNVDKLKVELEKEKRKLDFRNWPKQEILEKAINNFKHSQYSKAKKMLSFLYDKQYKIGVVSFYLAEIEYKMIHYKKALQLYKKSITSSKSSAYYIDDLLYHTGYSLEKLKQFQAAKKSYLKLINDYPKSLFVKYAKKRLQDLEKTK